MHIHDGVDESRKKLGDDTTDLLYHHRPRGRDDIETVLPVFEGLVEEGVVDRIGVSNYTIDDVERTQGLVDVPLYANHVEMHPLLRQNDLSDYLCDQDMYTVAYSPLTQGEVFGVPEFVEVADKHDTTPAAMSLTYSSVWKSLLTAGGTAPVRSMSSVPNATIVPLEGRHRSDSAVSQRGTCPGEPGCPRIHA